MEKAQQVNEEIGRRFREERAYRFTAGQVARRAKVSVNTAKKYLQAAIEESDSPLRDFYLKGKNGITIRFFAFVRYEV